MNLRWVVVAALAVGLGCSQSLEPTHSEPSLDTLRAALSERDELERTYLLTSFLRTLQPEDVEPLLVALEKHRVGIEADEVRLVMLAWTRFDGPGAFAAARDWPTPWRSVLMEQAMHAWGFHDGRAALAACEQIEGEELRESLTKAMLSGWVESHDRLGVSEYIATIPNLRRRSRVILRLAGEAKRDGPDAVIAWTEAIPEDAPNQFKEGVFGHAGRVLGRLDPERAAAWYERHMREWYSESALRSIAGSWAQYHDPEALLAWVMSLPIQEDREAERVDAVNAAFRTWAAEAPERAAAWLELAPAGPTRDAAIDGFVRATGETSPAEAVRWVGEIGDDHLRRLRTIRYTRQWFIADPDALQEWLAETELPDEWRRQILANLPQTGRTGNRSAASAESEG